MIGSYAVPCEFGFCRNLYKNGTTHDPSAIAKLRAGIPCHGHPGRAPGAAFDDVYFTSAVLSPPVEGPYKVNVPVDNGAAYEIWFKNVPSWSGGAVR